MREAAPHVRADEWRRVAVLEGIGADPTGRFAFRDNEEAAVRGDQKRFGVM